MALTLYSYAENPLGKKNAVFSNREMYHQLYTTKFDKILLRENGNISYRLYTKKDKYYIYLKIPSEVVPKFTYDVVIEFYTNDPLVESSRSLMNYNVRFFSNDPSFVFTFAKAFLDNDLFIKELSPKMSKQAIKKNPVEKNPGKIVGYVKSLYFSYLWVKRKSLLNKTLFENYGDKLVWKDLLNTIENADSKIADRQKKAELLEKKKRKEKQEARKELEKQRQKDLSHLSKHVSITNTVKTTSRVSNTRTVKTTNKIKRSKKV